MDERERHCIREAMLELDCDLRIRTMDIADYVVSNEIGIERKRGDDLTASICDNRFFTQLNMLSQHFKKPLIILENPNKMFSQQGVYEASIYGAIMYAAFKLGVSLLPTKNEEESAFLIWNIARIAQKSIINNHEVFEYAPIEIEKPVVDINSQRYFLEGLLGVSQKRAEILLEHFETPKRVIEAIENTEIVYTKSGKIKGISGELQNIPKFGPKFLKQNQKLILSPFDEAKSEFF
jgi:DNA excision repair protein ERCC-4